MGKILKALDSTNILQKMKFYIKDFINKCDLLIGSHLLKKSLMENFIFSAVKRLRISEWKSFRKRTDLRQKQPQALACNFIKKETLAQVFSCEFWEISKNTFLQNTSGQLLPLRVSKAHCLLASKINHLFLKVIQIWTSLKQLWQSSFEYQSSNLREVE